MQSSKTENDKDEATQRVPGFKDQEKGAINEPNDVPISGLDDVADDVSREKSKILLRSGSEWQG